MRIAIVEPNPSFGGGSEQISLELGQELSNRGHEIVLFHYFHGTMLAEYDRFVHQRIRWDLKPFGWRTLLQSIRRARRLAIALKTVQPDVVFSSDLQFIRFLAMVNWFSRIPVVIHLGIMSSQPFYSKRVSMKWIAAGISPSQHTADSWVRDGWIPQRLHVVNNWVNASRFSVEAENNSSDLDSPDSSQAGPVVCYVGRLVEDKGVSVLLEAWKRCVKAYPNAKLVMVGANGAGTCAPYDTMVEKLGIVDSVLFMGRTPNVGRYYRSADFSVVPSIWDEPFGLTVLEAMASGTPPVVSNVGILPQLVGETDPPLVVPSNDVDALALRMLHLMKMRTVLPDLGRQLRQRVIEQYAPDKSIDQYEQILKSVAVRHSNRKVNPTLSTIGT